ncbi:hypothetical protein [Niabella ginsengisoli]|uniref:Outer membrane protein beta-barrel domain-containing protein n=1 Tax=Niabella ginsengisoli TaxID=522298 RepID=A0ABS9SJM2_9BACT|nr:hypothetical protein [Niabella ginsengisoli]MCH5598550.1 hypothetical protein [Niabella ginsengisoli]
MTLSKYLIVLITMLPIAQNVNAQNDNSAKIKPALWDGMIIAGYADKGAFVNFGGPCIKYAKKPCVIALGMLPSLRIKEDKVAEGAKKNSTLTPSLGAGICFAYKHLALQVPVYYNAKTTSSDGRWAVGIGAGYKF